MERLGNKVFLTVVALLTVSNINAQKVDSNILGKWISIKPYYNRMMELTFTIGDSSYIEIVRNAKTQKITSTYKARFVMIKDRVIVLKRKSIGTNYTLEFVDKGTIKFYPFKKEFKESIPILCLFTFRKVY